jgi:hypothetical protein
VTTHRVVPTGDFPVGAGNANKGAGTWADTNTLKARTKATAIRVITRALPVIADLRPA